jgi:hypothetical protein
MSLFDLIPWPYRLLGIVLLSIACVAFGYVHGMRAEQDANARAVNEQVLRVAHIERKQAEVSNEVDKHHQAGEAKARVVYETITKEVIQYVASPHADAELDINWVLLYNAAIVSEVPDIASVAITTPSGLTTDDVLENAVSNYQTCNAYKRQLTDLQQWVAKQQEQGDAK